MIVLLKTALVYSALTYVFVGITLDNSDRSENNELLLMFAPLIVPFWVIRKPLRVLDSIAETLTQRFKYFVIEWMTGNDSSQRWRYELFCAKVSLGYSYYEWITMTKFDNVGNSRSFSLHTLPNTIERVRLNDMGIVNIELTVDLPNLQTLNLDGNPLSGIFNLERTPSLRQLDLRYTKLQILNLISAPKTLYGVWASGSDIHTVKLPAELNIEAMMLDNTKIRSVVIHPESKPSAPLRCLSLRHTPLETLGDPNGILNYHTIDLVGSKIAKTRDWILAGSSVMTILVQSYK